MQTPFKFINKSDIALIKDDNKGGCKCDSGSSINTKLFSCIVSTNPVSYTHLDVYKRQNQFYIFQTFLM